MNRLPMKRLAPKHDEAQQSLVAKVDQQKAETDSMRDQVGSLERQLAILNEQLAMRTELVRQGFVSRSQHLALQAGGGKNQRSAAAGARRTDGG